MTAEELPGLPTVSKTAMKITAKIREDSAKTSEATSKSRSLLRWW